MLNYVFTVLILVRDIHTDFQCRPFQMLFFFQTNGHNTVRISGIANFTSDYWFTLWCWLVTICQQKHYRSLKWYAFYHTESVRLWILPSEPISLNALWIQSILVASRNTCVTIAGCAGAAVYLSLRDGVICMMCKKIITIEPKVGTKQHMKYRYAFY